MSAKVALIWPWSNERTPKKSQKDAVLSPGITKGETKVEARPSTYHFGEFTLDVERGCVLKDGQEIKLRPKVYETLKYLVKNPGRLIAKKELIDAVWLDAFVTDDSLVQCTVELRQALNDREHRLLKTVPRRGYLFTAEVVQGSVAPDRLPLGNSVAEEAAAKSSRTPPPLPVARTALIGRAKEIAETAKLLLRDDVRLLTLTGPGGAGKTRLALAVAAEVASHFTAGVRVVGLASITQPDLVTAALAEAFHVRQVASRTVPELIAEQLQSSGPFLLLLDNFEQVLSAATLVAETLEACPSLKIMVTSRAGLRIYGEQEFPVAPLAEAWSSELFAQRASAVWPAFALTPENKATVRQICERLDGLPLAIELAAARIKMLSPDAILDRLQSRLQLLTGGALDLPERQQTLRNAIEWSYELLTEAERKLFRRLSVFAGGCTLEAGEAVCNTQQDLDIDLFEGLSALVDQNLIQQVERAGAEPRFAMLETIREYAFERLSESGEASTVRRNHAAYCLVLAEEGNPELTLADRDRWLAQCDVEIDNFRFALDWLYQSLDMEWGLRLSVALFRFWDMRDHLSEGRIRLETILRLAGDEYTKERARVAQFLGALTTAQGDFAAAELFLDQSLALYQEVGDEWGVAASFNAKGIGARDRGDYSSAQIYLERSLECWRVLTDRLAVARCLHNLANVVKVVGDYARAKWALREATEIFEELGDHNGAAWSVSQQGDIAREEGDVAAARAFYQRALSFFREAGDRRGSARALTDLGAIDCEQGDYSSAQAAYREALQGSVDAGYRRGVARALEGWACLALAQERPSRALTLAAAAAQLRHLIGASLSLDEQSKFDRTLLVAWESLTEAEGKRAWIEGSAMTLEEVVKFSLEDPRSAILR